MRAKTIHLLVVDGFADWEPAHALAELRRAGGYQVETVAFDGAPVQSMGGINVVPSKRVIDVDPNTVAAFILPGGDRWQEAPIEPELAKLVTTLDERGVPIAAICGATVAVARMGMVRGRRHTSNGLPYLRKYAPNYADAEHYVDAPAVRDRGLITASGLASVEFARELFEELDVMPAKTRALWATVFRTGKMPG
jgi:putative intracellular protease/amidase